MAGKTALQTAAQGATKPKSSTAVPRKQYEEIVAKVERGKNAVKKHKDAMIATGGHIVHGMELHGAVAANAFLLGYLGKQTLRGKLPLVMLGVNGLALGYGIYETFASSGKAGIGLHSMALGNGGLAALNASFMEAAGRTVKEKKIGISGVDDGNGSKRSVLLSPEPPYVGEDEIVDDEDDFEAYRPERRQRRQRPARRQMRRSRGGKRGRR